MNTTSQSKDADLHLITVLDDEIDNHEKFRTVAKPTDDDKIIPVATDAVNLFNSMSRLERLREMKAPEIVIAKEEQLIKKYRRAAERIMGKDVLATITDCRTKVHLLMDSIGGCAMEEHPFGAMTGKAVETVAYVTREASSLACNMMLKADRAYCLKDSYILWHLGRNDEPLTEEEDDEEIAALQAEEDENVWQRFRDDMNTRCRPNKRKKMNAKIDAARNHERREVVFSGRELASYGIVDYAYDTTRQLIKRFCAESGVSGKIVQQAPAVGDFFNLAYSAEALSKAVGFNCGLRRDRQTGSVALRIVDDKTDTRENRAIAKLTGAILLNQSGR